MRRKAALRRSPRLREPLEPLDQALVTWLLESPQRAPVASPEPRLGRDCSYLRTVELSPLWLAGRRNSVPACAPPQRTHDQGCRERGGARRGYAAATAALVPRCRAYMSSTHLNPGRSLRESRNRRNWALRSSGLTLMYGNSGGTTMRPRIEAAV